MKYLGFMLVFLFSFSVFGQIGQVKRLEIEVQKRLGDGFRVLNLGEKGVLVMLESEEYLKNGKREILLALYDTTLTVRWTRSMVVEQIATLSKSCMEQKEMYFLMSKPNYDYEIMKISLENGMSEKIEYEKLMELDVTRFDVLNGVLILGGSVKNAPMVVLYDYQKGKTQKVLPTVHTLKATLNQLVTLPADSTLALVLASKNRSDGKLHFLVYDNYGRQIRAWEQEPQEDYHWISYRPYFINRDEMYLFGTYSLQEQGRAQGVYAGKYVGTEQKMMRFYDFSYLNNFFNHLGEKRKNKLLKKTKEKREKGKVYQLDFSLFVKDLQVTDDRIMLIVESYNAVYTDNASLTGLGRWNGMLANSYYNRLFYDPLLDNQPLNRRPPLLYRYKHAAVCAFDKNGKLLWDNSFEYEDLESPKALAFLETSSKEDSLVMLHLQEDKLYLKKTFKSMPLEKPISFELKSTGDERDKIDNRDSEGLSFWYGKYFLLFGIQDVKKMMANNMFEKRKVFYLTKLYENGQKPDPETDKKEK